jgi:hypothetical protein
MGIPTPTSIFSSDFSIAKALFSYGHRRGNVSACAMPDDLLVT